MYGCCLSVFQDVDMSPHVILLLDAVMGSKTLNDKNIICNIRMYKLHVQR